MKFVRNIILVFALLLPSISMAEEEFSLYPYPIDFSIGGGPRLFSTSLEFVLGSCASLYETPKSDSLQNFFEPRHALTWTNRIRMIYDYDNHQYGFLFHMLYYCVAKVQLKQRVFLLMLTIIVQSTSSFFHHSF